MAHLAFGNLDPSQAEMEALLSRFADLDPGVVLAVFRRDQLSLGAFDPEAEYLREMSSSYANALILETEENVCAQRRQNTF
ncbi:hypothetical protein [Catenulispora sp. GAS73]|uniref:hypothetical protein n=1 Tax=Catenulispora sp. GAS73 TaxID=3156269 RepID=UPI003513E218